ncbi:hypothetical protein J3F84DRAFT_364899, partial [Trichoderma pleuroticola]
MERFSTRPATGVTMDSKIPTGPELATADIAHACWSRDKSNGYVLDPSPCQGSKFRGMQRP